MPSSPTPIVTVILPAYNAGSTIHETLVSVRAQSYANLEILVVDDGSQDGTRGIVERHAADDPRVRLLVQANSGVANARNRALSQATGAFVAPIDSDDLWQPDKIARQLALLGKRGASVELVYTWFAVIYVERRVRFIKTPSEEGRVLPALCVGNFVGQASSPLMRTQSVIQAGGYDVSLRECTAQGCEDWQLYLKLAEFGEFAVVKSPLTGYRIAKQSMSSDIAQMLRSHRLVMSRFQSTHPEYCEEIRAGLEGITKHLLTRSIEASRYLTALLTFMNIARCDPRLAIHVSRHFAQQFGKRSILRVRRVGKRLGSVATYPHFLDDEFDIDSAIRGRSPGHGVGGGHRGGLG